MVDHDSTGPSLQLVWARFSNFLLRKRSRIFKLRGMSILHEFQMAIFPYCWMLWSHGRARWDPICIAHTNVTLTWSKVKVKVIDLPKFRKLHFSTSTSSAVLAWRSQLMVDYDSMGPSLQLFRAWFLNFSSSWRHMTSKFMNVDITRIHCILPLRWLRLEVCDCDCRYRPQQAVHAGGDDHQPPSRAFYFK